MPKIVDREEMQNGILDAAMQVYAQKGYHAATIAEIAEAARLGKGTLYLYFRNKDAIAGAMVDRYFKSIETRLTEVGAPTTLAAFADTLSNAMNVQPEQARFIRVFFEIFGPSFASDVFSAKVAAFFDSLGAFYANQIRQLQAEGEIRAEADADDLGRAFASIVDGMILHKGLLSMSDARHSRLQKQTVEMFIRGLRP